MESHNYTLNFVVNIVAGALDIIAQETHLDAQKV